jgi:hypothetical protein
MKCEDVEPFLLIVIVVIVNIIVVKIIIIAATIIGRTQKFYLGITIANE